METAEINVKQEQVFVKISPEQDYPNDNHINENEDINSIKIETNKVLEDKRVLNCNEYEDPQNSSEEEKIQFEIDPILMGESDIATEVTEEGSQAEIPKAIVKRSRKKRKLNQRKWYEKEEERVKFENENNVEVRVLNREEQIKEFQERKLSEKYRICPYTCERCYRGFELEGSYKNHMAKHDKSRGKVECDICGTVHKNLSKLNIHARIHRLRIICNDCQYTTCCSVVAKEHHKVHTGYLFVCEHCGKGFSKRCYLITHVRVSHPSPQHCCDVCGEAFNGSLGLSVHKSVHKLSADSTAVPRAQPGEKPFICTVCDKRFAIPIQLQIHFRVHTGERPYRCHLCPKAFSNKSAVNRHMRVHDGAKPYPCLECGKTFTQSNSMKLHVRTVHLRLPAPYKSRKRKQQEANAKNK